MPFDREFNLVLFQVQILQSRVSLPLFGILEDQCKETARVFFQIVFIEIKMLENSIFKKTLSKEFASDVADHIFRYIKSFQSSLPTAEDITKHLSTSISESILSHIDISHILIFLYAISNEHSSLVTDLAAIQIQCFDHVVEALPYRF